MIKITPVGTKIIVHPLPMETTQTDGGIIAVDFTLERAEVVEVSADLKNIYSIGDIVLYPEGSGETLPNYKKKNCKWLDGRGFPEGQIWGLETEEK